MKYPSVVLGLALSTLSLAVSAPKASAFMVQAQIQISANTVTAEVYNALAQTLVCGVRVDGQRNDGFVENSFAQLVLTPGAYEYAYVYTTYPFLFINGQAFADCNFSGW